MKTLSYNDYNLLEERFCQSTAILDAVMEHPEMPRHLSNALWGARIIIEQAQAALDNADDADQKEAYLAGFIDGADDTIDGGRIICEKYYRKVTRKAYKKWRSESENKCS